MTSLSLRIDQILPQTQCTRCAYPSCAEYAQAIVEARAAINQCPPGGKKGIQKLAALTGQPILPLNPANGHEMPLRIALIDENHCIGCTLCIQVCPTDAIVGSSKRMHTVVENHCTGCELCIAACPVDCIDMTEHNQQGESWPVWSTDQANQARLRYTARQDRLKREKMRQNHALARKYATIPGGVSDGALDIKQDLLQTVLLKVRQEKSA
jgi:Na+-translocating ferredoxin:NAD+ oxidoreductase subunit B